MDIKEEDFKKYMEQFNNFDPEKTVYGNRNREKYFNYPSFKTIKEIIEYVEKEYPKNIVYVVKGKGKKYSSRYENDIKKAKLNVKEEEYDNYTAITYSEMVKDIKYLSANFLRRGYGNDKKVAIISDNNYEWYLAHLASLFAGDINVPLDKSLPKIDVISCLKRSKVETVFCDKKHKKIIDEILKENIEGICVKEVYLLEYFENNEEDNVETIYDLIDEEKEKSKRDNTYIEMYNNMEHDPYKVCILLFTSGTTSESKIVMLTQYNIATNIADMISVEDMSEDDTNIAFLPYHHTFGSIAQLFAYSLGMKTVFIDGLRYVKKNLKEYNVSVFVGVPQILEGIYSALMREIKKQKKEKQFKFALKLSNFLRKIGIDARRTIFKSVISNLGNLRIVINGGAGISEDVVKLFDEIGVVSLQGYGLTETSPVISAENHKKRKAGSVGVPMPRVDIKIDQKDEEGIGEILVKTPGRMVGYYNNEEATKEAIKDGWFYTGDLGYIDEDGYLFITGRKKNVIVLQNGKNVFPEEIELRIQPLELVEECFVFGFPKDGNEIVTLRVKYNDEVIKEKYADKTEEEIYDILWEQVKEINKTVPQYQYIKKMIANHDEMVKTTTNKIKRPLEIEKIIAEENKKEK